MNTAALAKGRRLFKRFWGTYPERLKRIGTGNRRITLVSLGRTPAITLADGPRSHHKRTRRVLLHGRILAVRPSGRGMVVLNPRRGLPDKPRLKPLGWVSVTEYVAVGGAKRGFKGRGTHWFHEHSDAGGKWPRAYEDQNGNIHYRAGSYRVGKWITR